MLSSGKKIRTFLQTIIYLVSLSGMIYVGYSRAGNSNWPEEKQETTINLYGNNDEVQNSEIHAWHIEEPDSVRVYPKTEKEIIRAET